MIPIKDKYRSEIVFICSDSMGLKMLTTPNF